MDRMGIVDKRKWRHRNSLHMTSFNLKTGKVGVRARNGCCLETLIKGPLALNVRNDAWYTRSPLSHGPAYFHAPPLHHLTLSKNLLSFGAYMTKWRRTFIPWDLVFMIRATMRPREKPVSACSEEQSPKSDYRIDPKLQQKWEWESTDK